MGAALGRLKTIGLEELETSNSLGSGEEGKKEGKEGKGGGEKSQMNKSR